MDGYRLGAVCRALRIRKGWRQIDLGTKSGTSRSAVSRLERGLVRDLGVDDLLRILEALGGRLDFVVRWQGGELDRLLNARHSALHEAVARFFRQLPEWTIAPEVSFAINGERGIVDILAWHAASRTLLVIELKTDIVDINELMGTLDRKRRLAARIARERGWFPANVGVWLIVGNSSTNRRRVHTHATTLRAVLPADGRSIRGWLDQPLGSIACLSFWSSAPDARTNPGLATIRRVRRRQRASVERANAH